LGTGVEIVSLSMEVPDVRFPFDVEAGPAQFRHHLCELQRLEVVVGDDALTALARRLTRAGAGVASLDVAPRAGFLELAGALDGGAPFTCKAALLPAGDRDVEVLLYEPRVFAAAQVGPAGLPALLARAAGELARFERGALVAEPLAALLRQAIPPHGWKLPRTASARLATLEVARGALRLAWDREGAAAPTASDPDLLAALEGRRAFSAAEERLATGDTAGARDAYLALGAAAKVHPFATARLLALLSADARDHDAALALATEMLARRKEFTPALLAVATVHAARDERAPAARAFAEVAALAVRRGERSAAMAAAEASLAQGVGAEPAAQACAAEVALSLRRDHLPALRALLALGERGDREAVLRACRRIAAYAPDAAEKTAAHARLGTMLLATDPAAARLHLDHALRLSSSDPDALTALARACEDAGDHLRAVRALDRVRELALTRGDRPGAARAALHVSALWQRAGQLENALLRCREACELAPSADAEERAAALAETLGLPAEAADHHARVVALLDPAADGAPARHAISRRALAAACEQRGDAAGAVAHLQAALALAPSDVGALRRLEALQRALGRDGDRRDTLDRLAALTTEPGERTRALTEAARLSEADPGQARRRWEDLLVVLDLTETVVAAAWEPGAATAGAPDPRRLLRVEALDGVARTARALGDAAAERGALERLAKVAEPGAARAAVLDRLCAALEAGGDHPGARSAAAAARAEEPSPRRTDAELRLALRCGDSARAAALLAEESSAVGDLDPARTAQALLDRAAVLAEVGRPDLALAAAAEAARRAPDLAEAHDRVAALAAGRDPSLEAGALLARARLARRDGDADAALRLALAGQAAVAAGRGEEGEVALREALAAGLGREDACAAWSALAARAVERRDRAAEREALEALATLLPTGQRPAALLRASELALEAGDVAAARRDADRARVLAPRDPAAVEASRAAAEAMGDAAALPDLLAALAALAPDRSGVLLLERARQLAALGRAEEADAAMKEALAALPPDAALAAEHARLRRDGAAAALGLPASEPLEDFARRAQDPAAAASALREGALLALGRGDEEGALRCARGAFARTPDDLRFAGLLLARLLYRMGAVGEALSLGRHLLGAGLPGPQDPDGAALCRELAELAEHAGDAALVLRALDRAVSLEPHDTASALRRFELDADRPRAVRALAGAAAGTHVARLRAEAFSRAAAAARLDLRDPALSDAYFAKARAAAGDYPAALARVEARRVDVVRTDADPTAPQPPAELLHALHDLAAARDVAGEAAGATASLEEAADLAAAHGLDADAIRDRLELERRASSAGDAAAAARHARAAGMLLLDRAGDASAAEEAIRRAVALAPGDAEGWRALEAAGRAQGEAGRATAAEALLARAALAPADAAAARRDAAPLLRALGRDEEARELLWALVRDDPRDEASAAALATALEDRHGERARLHLFRASEATGAARGALLWDASLALTAAGDEQAARRTARDAFEADPAIDAAYHAALRDSGDDLDRRDAILAARAAAVPGEAAACHRARAETLLARGLGDRALSAFEACLEHAPYDAALLAHVSAERAQSAGDEAAAAFDERLVALAGAGDVPAAAEAAARWRLGFGAASGGRPADAVAHLRRALALAPDDRRAPHALAALAEALADLGDADAALAAARHLAEEAPDPASRRAALQLGARLSERFADRGADAAGLLEALAALTAASEGGDVAEALAQRAVAALLRAGENARAEALTALAARTAQGPRRAAWLLRLAEAAAARGDLAAVRATRDEALIADPSNAALREAHLADLEAAGDAAALARALHAALAAPGANVPDLTLRLSRALTATGDDAGAERCFEAVVALGPGTPGWEEAARGLSARLEARGDRAGLAHIELARAVACDVGPARALAYLAASAHLEAVGDLDGARRAAEEARNADPDDAAPWRAVARLAGDGEDEARALLAVAIRSEGRAAAEAALRAAALLEGLGRTDAAARALGAAIAAVPGCAPARRSLAAQAREAGDAATAARHLAELDVSELPPDERHAHRRALARALCDARDPTGEEAWLAVFREDASDAEAFDHVAPLARGRGDAERWLALAAEHEGALPRGTDVERRRDLRCERAALLTDLGRLDAAEGAWQAALALDPQHRRALRGLRALLERRGDHASAADTLAIEATVVTDPAEAAEILLDQARLHLDQLRDRVGCAAILDAASERVRGVPGEQAARLLAETDRMRALLGMPPGVDGTVTDQEPQPSFSTLDLGLDLDLDFDPRPQTPTPTLDLDPRPSTSDRGSDRESAVAEARRRVRAAGTPAARATALRQLGELLAETPESLPEAAEALERAYALQPSSGAAAAALGRALLALGHSFRAVAVLAPFEQGAPDLPAADAARLLLEAAYADGDAALAERIARGPALARARADAAASLEAALARAREAVLDPAAVADVASAAAALRSAASGVAARRAGVVASAAAELAAFVASGPAADPPASPLRLSAEDRDRVAHPLARTAPARLVALLAPWLEALFPADLARRGITGAHRLGPHRAPDLLAVLDDVQRAIGARPVAAFLADAPGCEMFLENTQPVSLLLGSGMGGPIAPDELRFLAARALALADLGWALLGKFAPRDVAILCELACRFAGAAPPFQGLPAARAQAFLDALERTVPPTVRDRAAALAPHVANQLASLAPRDLAGALRETASRIALLHVGDARAALAGLLRSERRLAGVSPAQAVAHPELRDLVLFALSPVYAEIRAGAEAG
jgi:tetratricopeptide (TPR) repeat protein